MTVRQAFESAVNGATAAGRGRWGERSKASTPAVRRWLNGAFISFSDPDLSAGHQENNLKKTVACSRSGQPGHGRLFLQVLDIIRRGRNDFFCNYVLHLINNMCEVWKSQLMNDIMVIRSFGNPWSFHVFLLNLLEFSLKNTIYPCNRWTAETSCNYYKKSILKNINKYN